MERSLDKGLLNIVTNTTISAPHALFWAYPRAGLSGRRPGCHPPWPWGGKQSLCR